MKKLIKNCRVITVIEEPVAEKEISATDPAVEISDDAVIFNPDLLADEKLKDMTGNVNNDAHRSSLHNFRDKVKNARK